MNVGRIMMSDKKHKNMMRTVLKFFMLSIGAAAAAVALEFFLIPDGIIDGGVVGISIMLSHIFNLPTALFMILINIPFLWFGFRHGGKKFVVNSLYAIAIFSFFMSLFTDQRPATDDLFLATIFGGLILGTGVGIIVRLGGSLDGTEMLAIILSKSSFLSVGQVVLFCNLFIFGASGFVFGWDKAMYSLATYFIASKVIDVVVEGINESRSAMIVTKKSKEIAEAIMQELGRPITFIESETGFERNKGQIVYLVLTLMEISKLKEVVSSVDENAFVTITAVSDVIGQYKKRARF